MKKLAFTLMALAILGIAPAFAGDWAKPKQLSAEAGVDLQTYGIGAGAGVEYGLFKWKVTPQLKLNVAAKALASLYVGGDGLGFGTAGLVMLHYDLGQTGSGIDVLEDLEWFMGLGLGVGSSSPYVAANIGFSYDLTKDMAIIFENSGYSGGIIGLKVRL